ncbi:MAG: 4'-phosphopantetheinyl transferase superfamily protein [Cyanobacteria bacterium]|nr:4'-phosphopantetheinyl transferase superfamily protein [Cyanobacteria bacterium CG_2015-22_32_23]NCQ42997.1 4'-phosphopantetheinyl transferase superfamily protein [Cyanobacteria bacterium CG_2015-04_32_10]
MYMWNKPPQSLILKDNDVHIWMINIDNYREKINKFRDILSLDELEKANRFSLDKLKDSYQINRGYLRIILGNYLNIKPEEICFSYNQKGKPLLKGEIINKINFNLSHKNNYTVYALSKNNIGIDLEQINDKVAIENIARRFFCQCEFNYLNNLPKREKPEYFFKLWTIKEAYLKAIGEGLSGGLDNICFTINKSSENIAFISHNHDKKQDNNWYFKTLNLPNDYRIGIAINSIYQPNFYYYDEILYSL